MDNDKKNLILDKMTKICTCKSISRHRIKESIKKGNLTVKEVSKDTGACTGYCKGKNCAAKIQALIKEHKDNSF